MSTFKEVRTKQKTESGEIKEYSLFVKFEEGSVKDLKILNGQNEKPSNLSLEVFKEMVQTLTKP